MLAISKCICSCTHIGSVRGPWDHTSHRTPRAVPLHLLAPDVSRLPQQKVGKGLLYGNQYSQRSHSWLMMDCHPYQSTLAIFAVDVGYKKMDPPWRHSRRSRIPHPTATPWPIRWHLRPSSPPPPVHISYPPPMPEDAIRQCPELVVIHTPHFPPIQALPVPATPLWVTNPGQQPLLHVLQAATHPYQIPLSRLLPQSYHGV